MSAGLIAGWESFKCRQGAGDVHAQLIEQGPHRGARLLGQQISAVIMGEERGPFLRAFGQDLEAGIELKKPGVPARAAFDENRTHYNAEIPQHFWFNARPITSNGTDSRVGSIPYSKPKSNPS